MQLLWYLQTPMGRLGLVEEGGALTQLLLRDVGLPEGMREAQTPLLTEASRQLLEYFDGRRTCFSLALAPAGTPFQQAVWRALAGIPYGETRSYRQVAGEVGSPRGYRAVGMANNKNPIPILIPCHRVIGADGKLVGYAGGLAFKQELLRLEGQSKDKKG